MSSETVCAVVVTYNRKKLLIECLEALENQSKPVDAIYIVDNASTDGTAELLLKNGYLNELPANELKENFEKTLKKNNTIIHYLKMPENTGGAGGFHEGVKNAYKKGYDWLWLMDDDTVTTANSLKTLFDKMPLVSEKIGFMSSKILWKEGEIHLQNLPGIDDTRKPIVNLPFNKYEDEGLLIIETSTFVSFLINRDVIEKVGLPIKEFFIWADDIEYTKRILELGFIGIYSKDSIVYHKTTTNYYGVDLEMLNAENLWKSFYGIRNALFLCRKKSIAYYIFYFLFNITYHNFSILKNSKNKKLKLLLINTKACLASLLFNPKIQKVNE